MQDLLQEMGIFRSFKPATYAAKHSTDWHNMENFQYVTYVVMGGGITAGTKLKIQKATNKSGSGATNVAAPFVGNVYYTNKASAAKASYAKTSVTTSGSVHVVTIGASSSATYVFTVDATAATSASKMYLGLVGVNSSASSASMAGLAILHGARYQGASMPDFTL